MAKRHYHCYGCSRKFSIMINLIANAQETQEQMICKNCKSEYIEDLKSYEQMI